MSRVESPKSHVTPGMWDKYKPSLTFKELCGRHMIMLSFCFLSVCFNVRLTGMIQSIAIQVRNKPAR